MAPLRAGILLACVLLLYSTTIECTELVNVAQACQSTWMSTIEFSPCPTKQSSTYLGGISSRAVDNAGFDGQWSGNSCTHTDDSVSGPQWWRVDLGQERSIEKVRLFNRQDCCENRLLAAEVRVTEEDTMYDYDSRDYEKFVLCGKISSVQEMYEVTCPAPARGQYVWIYLAKSRPLTLCEVQVFAPLNDQERYGLANSLVNTAQLCPAADNSGSYTPCPAKQSSTYSRSYRGPADFAVDNAGFDGDFQRASCTHTEPSQAGTRWWRVDLGQQRSIQGVKVFNRQDCCQGKLQGFKIKVTDQDSNTVPTSGNICYEAPAGVVPPLTNHVKCQATGRYVWVYITSNEILSLCEVQVFAPISFDEHVIANRKYRNHKAEFCTFYDTSYSSEKGLPNSGDEAKCFSKAPNSRCAKQANYKGKNVGINNVEACQQFCADQEDSSGYSCELAQQDRNGNTCCWSVFGIPFGCPSQCCLIQEPECKAYTYENSTGDCRLYKHRCIDKQDEQLVPSATQDTYFYDRDWGKYVFQHGAFVGFGVYYQVRSRVWRDVKNNLKDCLEDALDGFGRHNNNYIIEAYHEQGKVRCFKRERNSQDFGFVPERAGRHMIFNPGAGSKPDQDVQEVWDIVKMGLDQIYCPEGLSCSLFSAIENW